MDAFDTTKSWAQIYSPYHACDGVMFSQPDRRGKKTFFSSWLTKMEVSDTGTWKSYSVVCL